MNRRALLIVNRHARSGGQSVDAVRSTFRDAGIEVVDPAPEHDGSLTRIIDGQGQDCDLVVLGGGDGTLKAAAPALVRLRKPLGVLPLGTANDFARTIGLPLDPVQAARVVIGGNTRPVDLGEVNGHLFFNVASVGFSAELAGALTAEAKKRWGVVGYAITAARMLARSRLFTAHIEHDGTTETVRTFQVSVGIGRHYGGGMTVDHAATADDGTLDFYSLEVDHWWKLLQLLPSLRKGTQGRWREVRAFRTTEITIRTSKPRPINTDGELSGFTPAHFRIRPKALDVYRP